jgi:hypothetical protein
MGNSIGDLSSALASASGFRAGKSRTNSEKTWSGKTTSSIRPKMIQRLTFAENPPVLAKTSVTLAAPIPPSKD